MTNDAEMMLAAVVSGYGPPSVVVVQERRRPRPGPRDLSIRVKATCVSSGDARVRALRVPAGMGLFLRLAMGWSGPRQPVLGAECAGVVEAVGAEVTRFAVGDEVVAFPGVALGAHAAFVCMREDGPVARKPAALSWHEAAALSFGGMTALHYLRRKARVRPGERVLILGASGAVGAAAVQIARHEGAQVTAVCSAANAALARDLGATEVIDYRARDFTQTGGTWDVVMDCVGATDYARCHRVLARGGRLLRVVYGLAGLLAAPFQGRLSGHRVITGVSAERAADVAALLELADAGVYRAVIDDVLPLARIAEAHARVDTGRKRGSVVITLEDAPATHPSLASPSAA